MRDPESFKVIRESSVLRDLQLECSTEILELLVQEIADDDEESDEQETDDDVPREQDQNGHTHEDVQGHRTLWIGLVRGQGHVVDAEEIRVVGEDAVSEESDGDAEKDGGDDEEDGHHLGEGVLVGNDSIGEEESVEVDEELLEASLASVPEDEGEEGPAEALEPESHPGQFEGEGVVEVGLGVEGREGAQEVESEKNADDAAERLGLCRHLPEPSEASAAAARVGIQCST